tara:strand:+ start:55 stop:357 length:303 start_codon:yes stop_codon:yes gene_type:complete
MNPFNKHKKSANTRGNERIRMKKKSFWAKWREGHERNNPEFKVILVHKENNVACEPKKTQTLREAEIDQVNQFLGFNDSTIEWMKLTEYWNERLKEDALR